MQKNVCEASKYVQKNVSLQPNKVQKNVSSRLKKVQKNVMMRMERLVLQQFKEWKTRSDRKPLIANGARQVGKTWALREFAKQEYKKEAYVLCRKNQLVEQIFKKDFDVQRILVSLRAVTHVDITPGDTLIILDEVQEIPEAIEALKYFCEMVNTDPAQVLINNQIFSEYKGGMTEEYVLQELKSRGIAPIYYHKTDNSRLELDFLIQYHGRLLPIEVKAEGNVRANSLTTLLRSTPELRAVRFSMLPYKEQEQLYCVPLYAV